MREGVDFGLLCQVTERGFSEVFLDGDSTPVKGWLIDLKYQLREMESRNLSL